MMLFSKWRNFYLVPLILCVILGVNDQSFAQITFPTPAITPAQAVQNVLLGAGITATNITYNGSSTLATSVQSPVKKFSNASAGFPLSDGVMLRTYSAPTISDADLQAITTNNVTNGVILEFDFIPQGDSLSFSYIFTSQEYTSFTCSNYNDVFGFFISGPGILGPYSNNAINIATVPNTNVPVGINTVNAGTNADVNGNCNAADPHWQNNSVYFTTSYNTVYNSSPSINSNFNGSTVELKAKAKLICGATYHIKLAISNVGDQAYNSGVFLKAGSFASTPLVSINVSNITSSFLDTVLVEGCDQGKVVFSRPAITLADTMVIHFSTTGTGIQGSDYDEIAPGDSVVFLPGVDSIEKVINLIDDNVDEPLEQVTVSSFAINECGDTIFSVGDFWIADHPVDPGPDAGSDFVVCNNGTGILNGSAAGNFNQTKWTYSGPGTINFSPDDEDLQANITATSAGIYTLYLTESNDTCSLAAMDSVQVTFENVSLQVVADTTICQNGTASIWASADGGNNFGYHWDFTPDTLDNQAVQPTDTTSYTVYGISENGCSTDTLKINVNTYPPISLTSSLPQTICPGDTAVISGVASGGIGIPYTFVWTDPAGNTIANTSNTTLAPIDTTDYTLTVSDGCETTPVSSISTINNSPLPVIDIAVQDAHLCSPATFEITNLTDPNQLDSMIWYISDGQVFTGKDNINPQLTAAGFYDITTVIITPNGCLDTAYFNDFIEVYPLPDASFTYYPKPPTVLNSTVHFQNFSTGASTYVWDFEGDDLDKSTSTETDPIVQYPNDRTGNYKVTLFAITEHQCIDSTYLIVEVKPDVSIYAPNAFTPDGDNYNQIWKPFIDGVDDYDIDIEIYNRWGEMVWESHNKNIGWDGTYGVGTHTGTPVKSGVYVWKVRAKDAITDQKYTWNGIVTVIY